MNTMLKPQGPVAIDDMTGFKVDHASLKRQWDGAMTVEPDIRNPQDTIRARPERPALHNPRPEPEDVFLATNVLDANGRPTFNANGTPIMTAGPLNGAGL